MKPLLTLSRGIDRLNDWVGRSLIWLVLASVLISAGNAVVRKVFDRSSNAMLEVQWYLFSVVFLLAAGYTLLRNEHVRIDLLSSRLSARGRAWLDIAGGLLMLLPFVVLVVWLSIPYFLQAWHSGEVSGNAGGLIRWPVYLMIPVGFTLLGLQGVSEIIKRIAFLRGQGPDPAARPETASAEEELAQLIRRERDASTGPSDGPVHS